MSSTNTLPYMSAYGNITRALEGIQRAQTPDRFTQDFMSKIIGLSGGSARPIIPFLKKTGFLRSDGSPTALYVAYRNRDNSGVAAAEAMRTGFAALYAIDEAVHKLSDDKLKNVVVQVTGLEPESSVVRAIVGSFKALRNFADFDTSRLGSALEATDDDPRQSSLPVSNASHDLPRAAELTFGYTINLNLPATADIAVFNAIFRSLREHLMDR